VAEEQGKSGRAKGVIGTLAGLLSGGAMMYLSPLVDRVIKPQKPVANFAVETAGLQLTLHNRSAGGDGWWDFGDGSALEPANATAEGVSHAYAKPGTYTVKLALRNFVGDEAERSAQVEVGGAAPNAAPPAILTLEAIPVSPQSIAPATYRFVGTAQNAELAVWDVDEQLEIVKDSPNQQDRIVTFDSPGHHVVQYAVLCGATSQKKTVAVDVRPAPANTLLAVLTVADSGTRVEQRTQNETLFFTPEADAKSFEKMLAPHHGFRVVEAKPAWKDSASVRNVSVQVSPDRASVKVTGELLPATVKPGQSTTGMVALPVTLKVERQSAGGRKPAGSTAMLTVPGTTTVPLPAVPADWVNAKRKATLELRYGALGILPAVTLPYKSKLTVGTKTYVITAKQDGNQAIIEVKE